MLQGLNAAEVDAASAGVQWSAGSLERVVGHGSHHHLEAAAGRLGGVEGDRRLIAGQVDNAIIVLGESIRFQINTVEANSICADGRNHQKIDLLQILDEVTGTRQSVTTGSHIRGISLQTATFTKDCN